MLLLAETPGREPMRQSARGAVIIVESWIPGTVTLDGSWHWKASEGFKSIMRKHDSNESECAVLKINRRLQKKKDPSSNPVRTRISFKPFFLSTCRSTVREPLVNC